MCRHRMIGRFRLLSSLVFCVAISIHRTLIPPVESVESYPTTSAVSSDITSQTTTRRSSVQSTNNFQQHASAIAAVGRDPHRWDLYRISPRDDPVWASLRDAILDHDRRTRVLLSHHTPGFILHTPDIFGNERLTDWTHLPDMLFLHPLAYFLAHPNIAAIYVEDKDDNTYSASSGRSDPGDVVTIGRQSTSSSSSSASESSSSTTSLTPLSLVLAIRRSELTFDIAVSIRDMQCAFFTHNHLRVPHADEFVDTLHGR